MNIWSLLYFSGFLYYGFIGLFGLSLNRKSIINIMFFLMCVSLCFWSFGYTFSTGAGNAEDALSFRFISTFGWTYFYANMLIFFIALTHEAWLKKYYRYCLLLYIPPTLFFLRFWLNDTGHYVLSKFGWVYVLDVKTIWSYTFDAYYLFCMTTSLVLLFLRGKRSQSKRERKQAQIIVTTMTVAFICGALTDTFLPLLGFEILPMAILFTMIVIFSIWVAITKYKMMNLTQEIAAEHVLVTMMDPVIVTNASFIIGQVNKAATALTEYTSTELIGTSVARIIADFSDTGPIVRTLGAHGSINGHELELLSKSGKTTPCLCSGVCVKSEYGERIGVVLVLHDITTRKLNEDLIQSTNELLKLKISKINNIFDNVKEGILTFNRDLLVQDEYSLECDSIFNDNIAHRPFVELLYPNSPDMQCFINALLTRIFESNDALRSLYIPLLPEEVTIGSKSINIHYKYTTDEVSEPMIMVILTDVTEKNQLENQMDQERKTLKMVIKAILEREDFIELVNEFRHFAVYDLLSLRTDEETLLRKIHTFKGNFGQFYMLHLVDHLDALEDQLQSKKPTALSNFDSSDFMVWLNKDLDIIDNYVGSGFFLSGERYTIENTQLTELEERIQTLLDPQDANHILPLIHNLRYKSFHDLLSGYPDYTAKLAERWGKSIYPFRITGDKVFVDPKTYLDLTKSMVHLFRNCIAHGIEHEDQRAELNKPLCGRISCEILSTPDAIQITVSDDGTGINLAKIEEKVLKEGLLTSEVLDRLDHHERHQLIFKHRISAKSTVNTLSGRGVGLAAIDAEVKKIGGTISVTSQWQKGTRFTIILPKPAVK